MTGDDLFKLEGKRIARVVCHSDNSAYGLGKGFDLVADDGTCIRVEPYSVVGSSAAMKIRELKRVKA